MLSTMHPLSAIMATLDDDEASNHVERICEMLRASPQFSELPAATVAAIARNVDVRDFAAGERIYRLGGVRLPILWPARQALRASVVATAERVRVRGARGQLFHQREQRSQFGQQRQDSVHCRRGLRRGRHADELPTRQLDVRPRLGALHLWDGT
jgi:hypothetical protein